MNIQTTKCTAIGLVFILSHIAGAAPRVDIIQVDPQMVFVKKSAKVIFRARLLNDTGQAPQRVDVMRLEGSGREIVAVAMEDDGNGHDKTKGDGIYTAAVTLRETASGSASFTVQAMFADIPQPIRSRPAFINVITGLTAKEEKVVAKIHKQGEKMYHDLTLEKGQEQARKETVTWLSRQEGVIMIQNTVNQGVFVKFNNGATIIVQPPAMIPSGDQK